MALVSYNLRGKVLDYFTAQVFPNAKVEFWKNLGGYSEMIGAQNTDNRGNFSFGFEDQEIVEVGPQVYFKVFVGGNIQSYTININDLGQQGITTKSLAEGNNNVNLYLRSLFAYDILAKDLWQFQLINQSTNLPVGNVWLDSAFQIDSFVVKAYQHIKATGNGYFGFDLVKDKRLEYYFKKHLNSIQFKVKIFDNNNVVIGDKSISYAQLVNYDFTLPYPIITQIDVAIVDFAPTKSITSLCTIIGLTLSSELQTFLSGNQLSDLRSIRLAGGLRNFSELSSEPYESDASAIDKLDSHARLEMISSDYELNNFFFDSGLKSVYKVAMAGFHDLIQKGAVEGFSEYNVAKAYYAAAVQRSIHANNRVAIKTNSFSLV